MKFEIYKRLTPWQREEYKFNQMRKGSPCLGSYILAGLFFFAMETTFVLVSYLIIHDPGFEAYMSQIDQILSSALWLGRLAIAILSIGILVEFALALYALVREKRWVKKCLKNTMT